MIVVVLCLLLTEAVTYDDTPSSIDTEPDKKTLAKHEFDRDDVLTTTPGYSNKDDPTSDKVINIRDAFHQIMPDHNWNEFFRPTLSDVMRSPQATARTLDRQFGILQIPDPHSQTRPGVGPGKAGPISLAGEAPFATPTLAPETLIYRPTKPLQPVKRKHSDHRDAILDFVKTAIDPYHHRGDAYDMFLKPMLTSLNTVNDKPMVVPLYGYDVPMTTSGLNKADVISKIIASLNGERTGTPPDYLKDNKAPLYYGLPESSADERKKFDSNVTLLPPVKKFYNVTLPRRKMIKIDDKTIQLNRDIGSILKAAALTLDIDQTTEKGFKFSRLDSYFIEERKDQDASPNVTVSKTEETTDPFRDYHSSITPLTRTRSKTIRKFHYHSETHTQYEDDATKCQFTTNVPLDGEAIDVEAELGPAIVQNNKQGHIVMKIPEFRNNNLNMANRRKFNNVRKHNQHNVHNNDGPHHVYYNNNEFEDGEDEQYETTTFHEDLRKYRSRKRKTTKREREPQMDMVAMMELIENLTAGWSGNLVEMLNKSLQEQGMPTCATPGEEEYEDDVDHDPYGNLTGLIMGKCYVCGLEETEMPLTTHCADAFAGNLIPLGKVDSTARGKIAGYKKYCRWKNIPKYRIKSEEDRTVWGRWTGGCSVRWIDVSGIYTQRTCRNRNVPTTGKHWASKRMAKLEAALRFKENGCIISPVASLVPLSRAISLYARFHACVCTGSWCNAAPRLQQRMAYIVILPFTFINSPIL